MPSIVVIAHAMWILVLLKRGWSERAQPTLIFKAAPMDENNKKLQLRKLKCVLEQPVYY